MGGSTRALEEIGKLTPISQRYSGNKSKILCIMYVSCPHWKRLLRTQKASDTGIVLAVDPPDSSTNEDPDLSERYHIVKLTNSIAYHRLIYPLSAGKVG